MHTDPDLLRNFESAGMSVLLKEGATETLQLGAIPASAVEGQ
jgi:hypothetical protein